MASLLSRSRQGGGCSLRESAEWLFASVVPGYMIFSRSPLEKMEDISKNSEEIEQIARWRTSIAPSNWSALVSIL